MPVIYGTYKDGSDIYKNTKGYYTIQWNFKTKKEYKKYLKSFKPKSKPYIWNPPPKKKFTTA
jgi:hypothetical protein